MIEEAAIGSRIRQLRSERGLSLQEVAERTGFTKGYLSKIETNPKAPPVSTLLVLARVLGISISEIFGEEPRVGKLSIVRRGERQTVARSTADFGYTYETLAHTMTKKRMEPFVITLPRGPRSRPVFQHEGEEMLFVLEGRMMYVYGDEEHVLDEGDCIYFDAGVPHHGYSVGDKETRCLIVIFSPP